MKTYPLVLLIALLVTSCSSADSTDEADSSAQDSTATQGVSDNPSTQPGMSNEQISVQILTEGNGEKVAPGAVLTMHYVAMLKASGDTFDNSIDKGQPIEIPYGMGRPLPPGWTEAIEQMSKGGKARVEVPSALGYGEQGVQNVIPPNSDLVFELELIDFRAVEQPTPIAHEIWETEGITPQETSSGLKVFMIEKGTGPKTAPGKGVSVHYHGYLLKDGKVFDSSFSRGEPITFTLGIGQVIPGWDEGIGMLSVGDKAVLQVPYHLAYGEQGSPPAIPAKADLVFDVEVVAVQ